MSVLVVTPDFATWLAENGVPLEALRSPPVAWGYIALYEQARRVRDDDEARPSHSV